MLLKGIQDSRMLILIFIFSNKNLLRSVLFAWMPPTFAAALITRSGLYDDIRSEVVFKLNKSVSSLVE